MKSFLGSIIRAAQRVTRRMNPVQTIAFGYAGYILLIFILISLPFTWRYSDITWIDHLFMATSAVSTTGLVTVNTPEAYNFWGQLILLFGMQLGGLGYMTLGSFAILSSRGKVSPSRITVGKSVFAMPAHFEPVTFIRRAVLFTLAIEVLGAVALYLAFSRTGMEDPLWPAIFHSISAFCTAGFSIFPNSLEAFKSDGWINAIISLLSISGAIGFIVISDLWMKISNLGHTITLTSKIILIATFGGIFVGTIGLIADPSLAHYPIGERLWMAFFQSMSALTTVGFNTQALGDISYSSVLVIMILMILGASPSGTGGGLKSTSWSAGLAATWSAVRGRKEVTFFGHVVPTHRIEAAFASFTLYLIVFAIGSFILLQADRHAFEDVMFEVTSGLGTVGLSRGITGDLTHTGKFVLIALMFIGRVGVISLGFAALSRKNTGESKKKESDLVI